MATHAHQLQQTLKATNVVPFVSTQIVRENKTISEYKARIQMLEGMLQQQMRYKEDMLTLFAKKCLEVEEENRELRMRLENVS